MLCHVCGIMHMMYTYVCARRIFFVLLFDVATLLHSYGLTLSSRCSEQSLRAESAEQKKCWLACYSVIPICTCVSCDGDATPLLFMTGLIENRHVTVHCWYYGSCSKLHVNMAGPQLGRTRGQSQFGHTFGLSLEMGLLRPGAGLAQDKAFIDSDSVTGRRRMGVTRWPCNERAGDYTCNHLLLHRVSAASVSL